LSGTSITIEDITFTEPVKSFKKDNVENIIFKNKDDFKIFWETI
jgi:hypothetical protein